jgi:hypothetical protein
VHTRSSLQHFLTTRGKHGLQRFDAIVRGLEKEILHDGLGSLELRDQHFRVRPARHFATDFGDYAIAACAMQHHDQAPLSWLHEIRGLGYLMLRDPGWTSSPSPFPSCHSFGVSRKDDL